MFEPRVKLETFKYVTASSLNARHFEMRITGISHMTLKRRDRVFAGVVTIKKKTHSYCPERSAYSKFVILHLRLVTS